MTTTRQTIAERILDRLDQHHGVPARTHRGTRSLALVRRIGTPVRDGWEFKDGSEIREHGGMWDTPEGWSARV